MSQPSYFDPQDFIKKVIEACKLGDVPEKMRLALEEAIERTLSDRIIATIIDSFEERELRLLEKVLDDHPELDEIDAVMIIAKNIPTLQEKIDQAMQELYKELTYDAGQIEYHMQMKKLAQEQMAAAEA